MIPFAVADVPSAPAIESVVRSLETSFLTSGVVVCDDSTTTDFKGSFVFSPHFMVRRSLVSGLVVTAFFAVVPAIYGVYIMISSYTSHPSGPASPRSGTSALIGLRWMIVVAPAVGIATLVTSFMVGGMLHWCVTKYRSCRRRG